MNKLTFFTCPKPFTNPHIRQIQRNAIGSWLQLSPRPEILLLGDEEGVAEVAVEFGVRHIPELELNMYGTPLLSSIFEQAEKAANYSLLCYINADIIVFNDFIEAAERAASRSKLFMMGGQRWDIDIREPLDYSSPNWERDFRQFVSKNGVLHDVSGVDNFLFPRNFWGNMPPFALGRTTYDNWFFYWARKQGAAVIDATRVVTTIHQNHDYANVPGSEIPVYRGSEATQNRVLAGKGVFTLLDANWLMTTNGFIRARTYRHIRSAIYSWPVLHPFWSVPFKLIKKLLSIWERTSSAINGEIRSTKFSEKVNESTKT